MTLDERVSETAIVLMILAALPKDGLWYRRNVGALKNRTGRLVRFGITGQADIGGMWRGVPIEIEVKIPGKHPTLAQKAWRAAVERAGGIYIVAHSVEEVIGELHARMQIMELAS